MTFYLKPLSKKEQTVYDLLVKHGEAHAPAIARASKDGEITIPASYTYLRRLKEKGLVESRIVTIHFVDGPLTRVVYKVKPSKPEAGESKPATV